MCLQLSLHVTRVPWLHVTIKDVTEVATNYFVTILLPYNHFASVIMMFTYSLKYTYICSTQTLFTLMLHDTTCVTLRRYCDTITIGKC